MSEFGLAKSERMHGRKAIAKLINEGRKGFVYPFRYIYMPACGISSVLFAVPKRGHKRAVERNVIRRRMKEAYRLNKALLGEHHANIALFYNSSKVYNFSVIEDAIQKTLTEIRQNL